MSAPGAQRVAGLRVISSEQFYRVAEAEFGVPG